MRKAVVTGATGFIGSNLVKMLVNDNWNVSVIQRSESNLSILDNVINDIKVFIYDGDYSKLEFFFTNEKPDVVFHLASLIVNEHKSNQISALVESNIALGLNLLEVMKNTNTRLMINTGTYWQHYNNEKYNPVNLYAATKKAFEDIIRYYTEVESIRVITLKLFDTYGKGDSRKKILNIISDLNEKSEILNMSPGDQLVDFIHISDVVNAYLIAYEYLLNTNKKNLTFGVGSKKPIKLKKIINLYEEITNKKLNINWGGNNYRNREVLIPWNKYKKLPGWKQSISIKEGFNSIFKENKKY